MKITLIDDHIQNLILLESFCEELGLQIRSFLDPQEALAYLSSNTTDIIILDYMMPKLNGIELIRKYRQKETAVPIVMVTAVGKDEETHSEALEAGANDFLLKPVNSVQFKARIKNLLELRKSQLLLSDKAKLLEQEVKKATQTIVNREHETLKVLGKTAEYKDPETSSHIARVAHYSKLMAAAFGLGEYEQELIFYASPFHDIGKVGIEDSILLKAGKLTEEEFEVMKTHPAIGYDILANSNSDYLKAGAEISINHHEKYDGSGYPNALKGEEIPLFGRIVAVADVFDALTSQRPYKKAWEFDEAMSYLGENKGTHFDPKLVDIFIAHKEKVLEIYQNFQEDDQ